MAGNDAIHLLRGNGVDDTTTLNAGQPYYNAEKNYLTIGSVEDDNKKINALPVVTPAIFAYSGDSIETDGKTGTITKGATGPIYIKRSGSEFLINSALVPSATLNYNLGRNNARFNKIYSGEIDTGTITASENATIEGTLSVTKATTLSSTVEAGGKITANAGLEVTGNTKTGTLNTTGATTLGSTLNVENGKTTLQSLQVTGSATLDSLSASKITLGQLSIDSGGVEGDNWLNLGKSDKSTNTTIWGDVTKLSSNSVSLDTAQLDISTDVSMNIPSNKSFTIVSTKVEGETAFFDGNVIFRNDTYGPELTIKRNGNYSPLCRFNYSFNYMESHGLGIDINTVVNQGIDTEKYTATDTFSRQPTVSGGALYLLRVWALDSENTPVVTTILPVTSTSLQSYQVTYGSIKFIMSYQLEEVLNLYKCKFTIDRKSATGSLFFNLNRLFYINKQ